MIYTNHAMRKIYSWIENKKKDMDYDQKLFRNFSIAVERAFF